MTPAELKTLRESLGLTTQWVADHAGVKLRTAQYWEAGRMRVPDDVADMLTCIDRHIDADVDGSLRQMRETQSHEPPTEVVLVRYHKDEDLWRFRPDMKPLPVTTHAAMLARLRRALLTAGILSRIEFMEANAT